MKMTHALVLAAAFLIPSIASFAQAEEKPAAAGEAAPAAEGDHKAKKAKKAKKDEKKEGEAAPAGTPAK